MSHQVSAQQEKHVSKKSFKIDKIHKLSQIQVCENWSGTCPLCLDVYDQVSTLGAHLNTEHGKEDLVLLVVLKLVCNLDYEWKKIVSEEEKICKKLGNNSNVSDRGDFNARSKGTTTNTLSLEIDIKEELCDENIDEERKEEPCEEIINEEKTVINRNEEKCISEDEDNEDLNEQDFDENDSSSNKEASPVETSQLTTITQHEVVIIDSEEMIAKFCEPCNKMFKSLQTYQKHMRNFHKPKEKCDICGKNFTSVSKHKSQVHGIKPEPKSRTNESLQIPCPTCGMIFGKKSLMIRHLNSVHERLDPYCKACRRMFKSEEQYQDHVRQVHQTDTPFLCPVCGVRFATISARYSHEQARHSHSSQLSCSVCNKLFKYESNLKRHVKNVHECMKEDERAGETTERLHHICSVCGKSLKTKNTLLWHMKTHDSYRPVRCEYCGKGFLRQCTLDEHVRIRHTGDKPFCCQVCGVAFPTKSRLTRHTHKHTGRKPHVCGVCHKSFRLASSLTHHMPVHTGEKPHACHQCGKSYSHPANLRMHRRRKHGHTDAGSPLM